MKSVFIILMSLSFSCFFSCDKVKKDTIQIVGSVNDTLTLKNDGDSIKTFVFDDFPISDDMIALQNTPGLQLKKSSGETYSFDKAWFTNKKLKQNLVVEMYTDFHRLVIFQFYTDAIPPDLLNIIELHTKDGELASNKQKLTDINGFLVHSAEIDSKYFTSNKGIQLGFPKQKILKIYGKPDQIVMQNGIEKAEWKFEGEILYNQRKSLNNKLVAKDSYGHQVIIYFRNEKVIAQILINEIP